MPEVFGQSHSYDCIITGKQCSCTAFQEKLLALHNNEANIRYYNISSSFYDNKHFPYHKKILEVNKKIKQSSYKHNMLCHLACYLPRGHLSEVQCHSPLPEASQPHALYLATCCLHLHPSLALTPPETETL